MAVLNTDAQQKGCCEHDEGDMAVPADVTANFILIEAEIFGIFEVDLHRPAGTDGQNDRVQRGPRRCEDQVIGLLAWVVDAAAQHQEVASIHRAAMDQRQDGPIKASVSFGPLAHREPLPVLGAQFLLLDACRLSNPVCSLGVLNADDFIGRDRHRIEVALLFQPEPQVSAVSIHGIGHHPVDRQRGGLCPLNHALGQLGFGLKCDRLGNMSRLPASRIGDPGFWEVQFAIDERVSLGRHVREEDAHLTVLYLSGCTAMLLVDSSRFGAPFGKATFIHDEHGKGSLGHIRALLTALQERWWAQAAQNERAHFVANPIFIPDGPREQALHAIGTSLFGMLSDLPAIFSLDLTEDSLQIEQGTLAWFGASKAGSQALMEVTQGQGPSSYLLLRWSDFFVWYGGRASYASLSDGYLFKEFSFF